MSIQTLYELLQRDVPLVIRLTETGFVCPSITVRVGTLFPENLDQCRAKCNLDPLKRIQQQYAQVLVEEVEADHLIEVSSWLEAVTSNHFPIFAGETAEIPEGIAEGAETIISDAT